MSGRNFNRNRNSWPNVGRMLDNIRLRDAAQLPPDYQEKLSEHQFTLDGRCCPFSASHIEIKEHTRVGETDEAILNWAASHGISRPGRRVPRLEPLHRQARLAGRTQSRPPMRIQESALAVNPIETLIDHLNSMQAAAPGSERACEKI